MKKTILLGMSLMLFWSCNSGEKTTSEEIESHAEHSESSGSIELNNGEKWAVNEEMKPFVLEGEELIRIYIQTGNTDYKTLVEKLKEFNSELIKSCTMTGKSHDELHKWLHPHLEIVKNLENETDPEKAKETVSELEHSYQNYHNYFQ